MFCDQILLKCLLLFSGQIVSVVCLVRTETITTGDHLWSPAGIISSVAISRLHSTVVKSEHFNRVHSFKQAQISSITH